MATPTYDELLAKLTLQKSNIATYTTDVGATAAEIADAADDLGNLKYAEDYAEILDGNKKTAFQIKQAIFNGDEDAVLPVYPPTPAGELPNTPPKPGAYQRFMERGKRWKTAPGWSSEAGTALGYDDGPAPKPEPDEVKPTIEVFAGQTNYHFSTVVGNRG